MAYQALYRKWRPKTFDDVVGQSHVIHTLKNEINSKKTAHAYLFCGTRGTGKTSCAKIFARAINCLHPVDGNPCNECEICRGAMDGTILDITEIDAASNNGVDNIRQIRDEVMYSAVHAKNKIYIIDEVHMLSDGAFNALLKTLEEPPPHVVFILATTEAHMLPPTITSRCQRFDFKRILSKDIVIRLKQICAAEKIKASEDALELIAHLADGALRDALSILDQCVCALPEGIDLKSAGDVLGIAPDDVIDKAVFAIAEHNSTEALGCISSVVKSGRDLNNFIEKLIRRFRDILILKVSDDLKSELLSYGEETTQIIKKQTVHFDAETASYILSALCDAQTNAKYSKSFRIIYELALIRLCTYSLDTSNEALVQRIARLENIIKNKDFASVQTKNAEHEEKKENSAQPNDLPPWDDDIKEPAMPARKNLKTPPEAAAAPKPLKKAESKEEERKRAQNPFRGEKPSQFGTWADILKLLKSVSPPLYGALACKKAKISGKKICFLNDGYTKAIVACMKEKFDESASCVLGYVPEIRYMSESEFDAAPEDETPMVHRLKQMGNEALENEQKEEAIEQSDEKADVEDTTKEQTNETDIQSENGGYEDDDFSEDDAPDAAPADPLEMLKNINSGDIHFTDE